MSDDHLNVKVRAATGGRPAMVELRRGGRSGPVVLTAHGANELQAIQRMLMCIDGVLADRKVTP